MNVTTFSQTVAVYVPTTINANVPASKKMVKSIVRRVMVKMVDLYGGCTVTTAMGGYKSSLGQIIQEKIYIVRSSAAKVNKQDVFSIALGVCKKMNQECVGAEINGNFNLVAREPEMKVA